MIEFKMEFSDVITYIWDCNTFPYEQISEEYTKICVDGKKEYNEVITAFDIETTTIEGTGLPFDPFEGRTYGFMYVWMFAVDEYNVCVGRTWREFVIFRENLLNNIRGKIVTYSHNLGFEFQFMRNFLPEPEKIFARNAREPVYVDYGDQEFRCSYILTNMGLAKFLEKSEGVTVYKADGEEFDYRILRYPDTELTIKEWDYAIRDVVGLVQGIKSQLRNNNDNLCTIPYTSTGYVRRDYLDVCKDDKANKSRVARTKLNRYSYALVEEAKRGGVAGSNALFTDETIEDVLSCDRKSSYPHVMLTDYFPDGSFLFRDVKAGSDRFYKQIEDRCCIMYVKFTKIKAYSDSPIPYISKSLCIAHGIEDNPKWKKAIFGNGKVYKAAELYIAITEIDFRIIEMCYTWEDMEILKFMSAPRGMLSFAFRKHLHDMFQMKTELETGDKYIYAKYKNKINASFGMMLTAILHEEVIFNTNADKVWDIKKVKDDDIEWMLKKHYRNTRTFLSYQDGVWTLAHARKWLYDGIMVPKDDTIATDTDSVKFIGEEHLRGFEKINKKIIKVAENFDVKPYAKIGDRKVYLGVWEQEDRYELFRTLGAKKYAYTLKKEKEKGYPLHVTVAGLNKETGAKYLDYIGGIEMFKDGIEIPPRYIDKNGNKEKKGSGRTSSVYNDITEPIEIEVNGHKVIVGSNIGVTEVPYTIGVTNEWMRVIDGYKVGEVDEPF